MALTADGVKILKKCTSQWRKGLCRQCDDDGLWVPVFHQNQMGKNAISAAPSYREATGPD